MSENNKIERPTNDIVSMSRVIYEANLIDAVTYGYFSKLQGITFTECLSDFQMLKKR